MVRIKRLLLLLALLSFISGHGFAQPVPVGDLREEQLRIQQLFNDSLSISFSNRPVWNYTYQEYFDSEEHSDSWWDQPLNYYEQSFDFFKVGIYNPVLTNTHNTRLPIGENNGAAWYGKGLTTEFKSGLYATSDYATLTFRPHIAYQQNLHFEVPRFVPRDTAGNVMYGHKELGFGIDNPFRFGPDPYWTFNLGHSSFRLHYKNIEAGLSTEPLWWGPGIRYALMMSNNAPGVKHAFLGSRAPISIPYIGNIEFRWIWGWPEDSEYYPDFELTREELQGLTTKRFMNGLNVNFSPSIAPNLHIGITRVFYQFIPEDGLTAADYFDIFQAFQKENRYETMGVEDDIKNQLASAYMRWVFPDGHMEIYGEYFKEDHNWDFRDFLMEPNHNGGYTFGFQKIFETDSPLVRLYKVNFEINQLEPPRIDEVRSQAYYYTHSMIRQGHTNGGQILGAAIGPGSNSQYLGVEGYFDRGKLGLFVQRMVDNNHFHYEWNRTRGNDIWRHRINMNIGSNFLYSTGNLIFTGKVMWTKAYNYGRFDYGQFSGVNFLTFEPYDVINLQFRLGVRWMIGG